MMMIHVMNIHPKLMGRPVKQTMIDHGGANIE